jgi:hypothetical protein
LVEFVEARIVALGHIVVLGHPVTPYFWDGKKGVSIRPKLALEGNDIYIGCFRETVKEGLGILAFFEEITAPGYT